MHAEPSSATSRTARWECDNCGWVGTWGDMDHVADPRPLDGTDPHDWLVCPACRAPEKWTAVCDVVGCNRHVSAGWPSSDGYRQTCSEHIDTRKHRSSVVPPSVDVRDHENKTDGSGNRADEKPG